MDLLHFLNDRLSFALYLYDSTVPPFEEMKCKIDTGEPPYATCRHVDDYSDEPPFLEEWEKADLAIDVIGMSCLGLVKIALHTFLKDFVRRSFGDEGLAQVASLKGSWLGKFRVLFATSPEFDWNRSGADLELIEQMVLTRNDFEHNADLIAQFTYADDQHAEKYPESHFRHPTWPGSLFRNARLLVTREKLESSVIAVRTLAEHITNAARAAQSKGRNAAKKVESRESSA